MESIRSTTQKIKGGWDKMDPGKRKAMVLAVSALTLFVVLFSFYSRKVEYSTLFSGLELQDAAAITQDLDTRGNIKYKIENGGRDILIDKKYVDKYRLELAMNGMMPENSTGFEIFDDMGMMVTDEDRKIMYQRGLEGELQRSIMSLSEIESARVHLVLSEDSIFDTERREASASVILSLKTGAKIGSDAVLGIIALVTGAVDNLPDEKVQIIDTRGNLLSMGLTGDNASGVGLLDKQTEIKRSFEKEIENNILNLLGPAFGPDKLKVAVYADLDFDAQEQTVIEYRDPVIRSEQNSAQGPNLNVGEITDNPIDDNAQNVLDGNEEDGMGFYEGTNNYELTETTTNTVKAPGKVQKISTSVLYDGNLTEAQLLAIRNLVSTATGYDLNRGDIISVESLEFDKSYHQALEEQLEEQKKLEEANRGFMERYGDYIYLGMFSVLGLVLVLAVARIMFGNKKKKNEEEIVDMIPQLNEPTREPIDIIDEVYQKFEVKENKKEKQLKEYAEEHPEIAADLIKAWMKE